MKYYIFKITPLYDWAVAKQTERSDLTYENEDLYEVTEEQVEVFKKYRKALREYEKALEEILGEKYFE